MGWFYGFKLHMICDSKGELCNTLLTTGNTDDRKYVEKMSREIKGKMVADKGYISAKLAETLRKQGLRLITNLRSNMKQKCIPIKDKILLRKRSIIETVFGQMKCALQIQHTRHRSPCNGFANIMAALSAFCLSSNKPKIRFKPDEIKLMEQEP